LKFINKIKFLILILIFVVNIIYASEYSHANEGSKYSNHLHHESSYQHAWCSAQNGIEEYKNKDSTRVDCLTLTHAVEFDFARKWAESIGQALHYQYMTGKKGKVVLILENPEKEMVYYKRVENLGRIYDFDVEYVTSDILHLKNGKCPYSDCRCKKQKNQCK